MAYAKRVVGEGGADMERNVQCVDHGRNNVSEVSEVCVWDSMLHSPISAANVMIAVCCFTNLTPMCRNIDCAFINSHTTTFTVFT